LARANRAYAIVFCYVPDALIGAGVINERNTVGCFSSHGLFVVVFLNEFRERFCERVRAIGEELRNQSLQFLAGHITKRSPCRRFPLRKPLGEASWFCHHICCNCTRSARSSTSSVASRDSQHANSSVTARDDQVTASRTLNNQTIRGGRTPQTASVDSSHPVGA